MFAGLELSTEGGKNFEATLDLAKRICPKTAVSFNTSFNFANKTMGTRSFGIFHHPEEWMKVGITHESVEGAADRHICKKLTDGTLSWHNLIRANEQTWLGSRVKFDLTARTTSLDLGIDSKLDDSTSWKAKINHKGGVEAALKSAIGNGWTFTASTSLDATKWGT